MYPCSIQTLHTHALFASPLPRSDDLSPGKIRQAIAMALEGSGAAGCAGRVAQEFGDHPETAAVRMRWARATVAALDGQSVPRTWRIAAADSSALGRNPTAGLSAIKSAQSATGVRGS
jgi:hypothetical protein